MMLDIKTEQRWPSAEGLRLRVISIYICKCRLKPAFFYFNGGDDVRDSACAQMRYQDDTHPRDSARRMFQAQE